MEKKLFDIIELKFLNDTGQMFCGINSDNDLQLLNKHLSTMDQKEKDIFFTKFFQTVVLTKDFINGGYGLEDLVEIINWVRYNFYN